jgi:uncharacterized protein (TIGR04551 family)
MHYTKAPLGTLTLPPPARRGLRAHKARWVRWVVCAGVLVIGAPVAHAQINPGPGMGPSPSQQGAQEEKKDGVAEAAPKAPGLLPTTPALPAPKSRRKRWKLFELDGYYRMRTDWFKNFNLGFNEPGFGGVPFPTALGCKSALLEAPCDNSLSSANMRLRLEPTINLDEGTSVHVQADLLDNILLGSTPLDNAVVDTAGVRPPIGAFNDGTQAPVAQGINSDRAAIQIKRAWAEVAVPLGILKFGRMPNHWGMGVLHNAGGIDPINGTYDYDADYGDTVDRASFSLLIPGTNLRAMLASDWNLTRLVSNQTTAGRGREGHPFDLDDEDDVNSWVGVISRMDSPQEFRDTIERGELAFNYGVYFEYKTQSWDYNLNGFLLGGPTDPGGLAGSPHYVPRNLKTYSPDVWAKIGFGRITFELEAVAQFGSIENLGDALGADNQPVITQADIRKYGGAARFIWRGMEGKLKLGIEGGFASGDQWDNTPQGTPHIAFGNPLGGPGDTRLTQFQFDRDYKVDQILWRHLIGAVNNAAFAKPFIQYDVTNSISFKIANITSFAVKPIATPGNSEAYGTEFNGDLGYASGGLFIGATYGVLFPLGAMAHPSDNETDRFGYTDYTNAAMPDTSNTGDAETAHVIQSRFVLAF